MIKTNSACWSYKNRVLFLILFLSLVRLVFASAVELGNDECYYWFLSQHLKSNYFDHPPMVEVLLRLFTANLSLAQFELFVRLGSIVSCALSTWFMFQFVSLLSSEKAGWFAACFYSASFYAGISAGILLIPDAPQMIFWTWSLWMIAKINADKNSWLNWILFGVSCGLCIMSKVHGIFIWFGFGLYILFYEQSLLKKPQLYFSLMISFIIALPILLWNIKYDFLTFKFNSERIDVAGFSLNWNSFLTQLCGQLLINNPFNAVFIFASLIAWRRRKMERIKVLSIYNFIALPLILMLLFISLYREKILPHWSGPAYITVIPLAAIYLAQLKTIGFPRILYWSLGSYLLFLVLCLLAINNYPGNFGSKETKYLGTGDLTLDSYGWKEAGRKFDSIYLNEIKDGIIPRATPVVSYKWWGAHEEYYFCKPLNIQMIGLGDMNYLHEYMWTNEKRRNEVNFSTAYCIVPSSEYIDANTQYKNYYSEADSITTFQIWRGEKPAHTFTVYRLKGWKGNLPQIK